jgi:GTP-binding protein HflX
MSREPRPTRLPRERALVCGVRLQDERLPRSEREADLGEAFGLVAAAEAEVVGEAVLQHKPSANPATLFGKGKVDEIKSQIEHLHPDLIVVDNDLSPAQARNLEKAWGVRIVDRSELILDIFAKRAKTKQARLQVELAQNEYMAPRLRRMWTHLERHEGAIGTRGPGETQLETDKRLLRKRILNLKQELAEIEARKQREVRSRSDLYTIGLVGYTNAGKSTLLNRLTGSDEFVADMLFATLDTRTRQWRLADGRTVLLSDTVGFLQRLPHHLVASFHATLEETLHADLLLHVVDAAHPDAEVQMQAVEDVIGELAHTASETLLVFNKIDRIADRIGLSSLRGERTQEPLYVSAVTGEGLLELERAIARRLDERSALIDVFLPMTEGRFESLLRKACTPLEDDWDQERLARRLRVRLTDGAFGNLRRAAGPRVSFQIVRPALHSFAPVEDDERGEPGLSA